MDWYSAVFELIDMRSFSNLWYWIALAAVWSQTSRYVLGVPYDMIQRAGRYGGQPEVDMEDLVRINCNRLIYVADTSGLWIVGLMTMLLTSVALVAFAYDVEFAQAVFLLGAPMVFVGVLSLNTARTIRARELSGKALRKTLRRHRTYTQFIGMIAIFITALWGMYQNMTFGALGL